jgi:hypothetical protein
MISERDEDSDGIGCARGTDISKLGQEFDIHPDVLKATLDSAAGLLRVSQENVRPADKKALRGAAKTLAQTIDRLSDDAVRERLQEAVFREPDGPDDDGLAHYTAWWAARDRVNHAIEGAQDLLALVRTAEKFKIPAGRPQYHHWTAAIASLLDFWTDDLGRKVTISGHAADPLVIKPSLTLRFVHQCMQSLDEKITEQTCRTILQKLRDQKVASSRTAP